LRGVWALVEFCTCYFANRSILFVQVENLFELLHVTDGSLGQGFPVRLRGHAVEREVALVTGRAERSEELQEVEVPGARRPAVTIREVDVRQPPARNSERVGKG